MRQKRIQSIISLFFLSLCLALLIFLGMWIFHPEEIVYDSALNTVHFSIIGLSLGILVYFFVDLLTKRFLHQRLIMNLISNIALLIATILMINSFLEHISTTWEWWITQYSWFIRKDGISVGIFLGSLFFHAANQFRYIAQNLIEADKSNQTTQIAYLTGLTFANFALINFIFNPYGFLPILLFFFGALVIKVITDCLSIKTKRRNENEPQACKEQILSNPHLKFFIPFAVLEIAMIIYSFVENWDSSEVYLIALPGIGGLLFLNIWSTALKLKRSCIWKAPKGINTARLAQSFFDHPIQVTKEQFGTFIIAIFSLIRLILPMIMLATLWYGFTTVFGMPYFHMQVALWSVIGVILAFLNRKRSPNSHYISYLVIMGLLIGLVFLLNSDIVKNAYSYRSVEFDIIFPFQVLLSPLHAGMIGIASGYIFTLEIKRFTLRFIDASNVNIKSMLIPLLFFVFGMIVILLGVTDVPGGHIAYISSYMGTEEWDPAPFLENQYSVAFYLIIASASTIILVEFLVPMLGKSNAFKKLLNPSKWSDIKTTTKKQERNNSLTKRKALIILAIILVSVVSGVAFLIPKTFDSLSLDRVASNSAVNVYATPSNVRIGSNQIITAREQLDEKKSIYNVSMAKNEYESIQLIIQTKLRALNGFSYKISTFRHADGSATISAENIEVRYAEYLYYETMPERLRSFTSLNLIEKRNHLIWITSYVPYFAKAGSYNGFINFTYGNQENFLVNLSLDVWNFTLPNQRHIRSNFGSQSYNDNLIESYHEHNINTYGIPIKEAWSMNDLNNKDIYSCYYNTSDEDWVFNWTWWDQKTEEAIQQGTNGFSINNPRGMPREPWWYEEDMETISEWGNITRKFYQGVQAHFEDKIISDGKNWFNYAYIYFIDEFQMFVPDGFTRQSYFDALEGFLDLLNSSAPDLKIMTTTPPSEELADLSPYIDIYCPVSYDYDAEAWNAAKDDGKEMWMYACVGPRAPYPNSHTYNRLYEIRVLYWQVWHYDLHGFLYWSTTPYYHGNYGWGFNAWGDAWYLYEEEDGSVDETIRWENWRDATDDYEYIWLMNATIAATGGNPEEYALHQSYVSTIVGDYYEYCDSYEDVLSVRSKIGDWLSDKNSLPSVNTTSIGETDWNPP